jgi:hypothetical protein
LRDVDNAKPRMRGSEFVKDAACRVLRPVVDGNYLQIQVIDFHQRGERGGQFFFFVTRREEHRDTRAIGVGCRREIPDPGEADGAKGNAKAVGEPEERNETKENQSEKMHGNWCQRCPRVILTRDAE